MKRAAGLYDQDFSGNESDRLQFPPLCPFTLEQALDEGYWPD